MRKLFFSIAFLIGVVAVNAQTEKGTWVVSGNTSVSFASTTAKIEFDGEEADDDVKTSAFSFTPGVGYFVIDNLAVGLDLQFTSNKIDDGSDDVTTSSFAAIPSGTYYFEAGENLKPFVGAGVGFVSTSSGDDDSLKSSGLAIAGQGGLAYFIRETIALEFAVQYLNTNQKNKEFSELRAKNSSIGVAFGFSLFL